MKHARPVHMENMHMLCCDSVKTCGPASLDREGFGSVCMCSMCMWENSRSICEVVWSLLSGCLLGAVQAVALFCCCELAPGAPAHSARRYSVLMTI